jgi:spore maturation protein CgeB
MSTRVILVGIPKPTHVGHHLINAAPAAGIEMSVMNTEEAFVGSRLTRLVCWRLLGHRPSRLAEFSARLVERCQAEKPDFVLTTGLAPVNQLALTRIAAMGIPVGNFLTDDPWNPAHRAPWFMHALPHYQHVFTPRHANEADLMTHGVKSISYLPFAYAPEAHHPPSNLSVEQRDRWSSLIAFIGGADTDRVSIMRALIRGNVPLALWGGYWERYNDLAPYANGFADADNCQKIVAAAGANLCLVRRANRDGHSMRSYEMPAIGGVMLVEDTPDHRSLYGPDREAVFYFNGLSDLVSCAKAALALEPSERNYLRQNLHARINFADNSYTGRLVAISRLFGKFSGPDLKC